MDTVADEVDGPKDPAKAKADALALAEQAEAEAAEAEALAAAARARARAIKLRREAQAQIEAAAAAEAEAATETRAAEAETKTATKTPAATETPVAETEAKTEAGPGADETPEAAEEVEQPTETTETPDTADSEPARRRLSVRLALSIAAVLAIVGLLGASGWMAWQHQKVVDERQQAEAYIATARQGIVNLTSLDFKKSKEDVQRILDSATGDFRDQFQKTAEDFASVVKDTQAVAEGTVAAAAVESMNKDSAVVLVLANERVTNAAGAKDAPRTFRFKVSVVHEGDQLKLSKVEFVL